MSLRVVVQRIRAIAPLEIARFLFALPTELWYDLTRGVNTAPWRSLQQLRVPAALAVSGVDYQPTFAPLVARVLDAIPYPPGSRLVDLGCGKGRVLLIAAERGRAGGSKQRPLAAVVGVELAPELCAIARRNLRRRAARLARAAPPITAAPARVFNGSATTYQFDPADNLIFLFNPFLGHVLAPVIDNLERSLRDAPRPVWVIYVAPYRRSVIEGRQRFALWRELSWGGIPCRIYHAPRVDSGALRRLDTQP